MFAISWTTANTYQACTSSNREPDAVDASIEDCMNGIKTYLRIERRKHSGTYVAKPNTHTRWPNQEVE